MLTFAHDDRRARYGAAEPRERVIAKFEFEIAFNGHDRGPGAQIEHGGLGACKA